MTYSEYLVGTLVTFTPIIAAIAVGAWINGRSQRRAEAARIEQADD